MDMSRDDFLKMMISELELMKDSDGQLHKEQEDTIDDIIRKLQFDFPNLEDAHLSKLNQFIISLKSPQSQTPFYLSERFLENMTYISSSPSYSASLQVPGLCESLFVSLPSYLFKYEKQNLVAVLHGDHANEGLVEWIDMFRRVKALLLSSSASFLGPNRGASHSDLALRNESIEGILNIVSFVVNVLCETSLQQTVGAARTLEDFIADSIHSQLTASSPPTTTEGDTLSCALDIVGHLLFLVRDLCVVSPYTGHVIVPRLLGLSFRLWRALFSLHEAG